MTHPLREKARELRRRGWSYSEIRKELGIQKSTLHYMLVAVELAPEQEARLKKLALRGGDRGRESIAKSPAAREKRKRNGRRIGELAWRTRKAEMLDVLAVGRKKGHLQHTTEEIEIKPALEKLFGCVLSKELVGGRYIDFASATVLAETTYDNGKGISLIIDRFRDVQEAGDVRPRHAFIPMYGLGATRRRRFAELGVTVHNIHEV